MATITRGKTFISGETVEPADMHQLVESATIAGIVNADIDANAAIAASKLALTGAITDTQLATGAVTGAAGGGKIAASAITGQTTIADALADTDEFLVHDASASALRKVAYSSIAPTVTAAKLDGVAKDGSGSNLSAGTAPIFGCRAWVHFDGTRNSTDTGASTNGGNVKIRASGNVSSVLKNGPEDYTINFTTAMPDANYCVHVAGLRSDGLSPGPSIYASVGSTGGPTTSSVRLAQISGTSAGLDFPICCVSIFR